MRHPDPFDRAEVALRQVGLRAHLVAWTRAHRRACAAAGIADPEARRQAVWLADQYPALNVPVFGELLAQAAALHRAARGLDGAQRDRGGQWLVAVHIRELAKNVHRSGAAPAALPDWLALFLPRRYGAGSWDIVKLRPEIVPWTRASGHLPERLAPLLYAAGMSVEEVARLTPQSVPDLDRLRLMAALRGAAVLAGVGEAARR